MQKMGTKFRPVWFLLRGTTWSQEDQVDDPETLRTTIDMAASRMGARAALWDGGERWWLWLFRTGDGAAKSYPSREAAEMVAIHVR